MDLLLQSYNELLLKPKFKGGENMKKIEVLGMG